MNHIPGARTSDRRRHGAYGGAVAAEAQSGERHYMKKTLNAFEYYRIYAMQRLERTEQFIASLMPQDQYLLAKYRKHLTVVRKCINSNQELITEMMQKANLYDDEEYGATLTSNAPNKVTIAQKIDHQDDADTFKILKAQSTLKLISRDWSSNGAIEREQSYRPIIDAVEEFYPRDKFGLNDVRILVPGAGLGRLTYELACLGHDCEGNEFSYFMLIASYFVINSCDKKNGHVLYPWVHQYVNNLRHADQVAEVHFPDVCVKESQPAGTMVMTAGDFLEVYTTHDDFDCVATCFFIDCANNIIEFIRNIYNILKPGGIWINLGPLLYHYSDIIGENSIEPSLEDLLAIIEAVGFEMLRHKTGIVTKYAQNPASMLQSEYESVFWICRKPLPPPAPPLPPSRYSYNDYDDVDDDDVYANEHNDDDDDDDECRNNNLHMRDIGVGSDVVDDDVDDKA